MDSTVETNITAVITSLWTYFFQGQSTISKNNSGGTALLVQTGEIMGYAGAAFAFFLSLVGAY